MRDSIQSWMEASVHAIAREPILILRGKRPLSIIWYNDERDKPVISLTLFRRNKTIYISFLLYVA